MAAPASPPDPRIHCPACGKRFRVEVAALEDRGASGAPARCTGCRMVFRVCLGEGGEVEIALPSKPQADAPSQPPRKRRKGRSRRGRVVGRTANPRPSTRSSAPSETSPPVLAPEPSGFGSGERLGRYEVEAQLGRGGMGAVYRAFDPAANRHVALKVLSGAASAEDRARFRREVEVQGNVQHPHLMPIYDSGLLGTARYFTMRLLSDPLSLGELVTLRRMGQAGKDSRLWTVSTIDGIVRHVVLPICQAIHHANVKEGVLHRDLKPDNVLLDLNSLRPYVIDFGICSLLARENRRLAHLPMETAIPRESGGVRVTGTLLFMPPEQARGNIDRRGDVWALGAILQYVVTGAPPLAPASRTSVSVSERIEGLELLADQARAEGREREEARLQRKIEELESGRERSLEDLQRDVLAGRYLPRPRRLSRPLEAIISKAMSPDVEQRYRHALELHDDLLRWLEGRPVRALLECRGPVRRGLYRAHLFLTRHRVAAALLLLAGGLGAAVAVGLLRPSLSAGPGAAAANAHQAHRVALDRSLAEAQALELEARRAFEKGDERTGRDRLTALAAIVDRLLLPELMREPETDPSALAEAERLSNLARGTRHLVVAVPHVGVAFEAIPVTQGGGRARWDAVQPLGSGGAQARGPWELPLGTWLLRAHREKGVVWLPVHVAFGDAPLTIDCPVDPARVPVGKLYVAGGLARGPLGEQEVEALVWDRSEVTVARYAAFLETLEPEERIRRVPRRVHADAEIPTPLWPRIGGGFVPYQADLRRPVEGLSLEDAQAFARFAGGRLPSAAEWAWAACGPDGRLCAPGTACDLLAGDVHIDDPVGGAPEVGTSVCDRSPFGLRDTAGGVAEFTGTRATLRGRDGWLVMGGGYRSTPARALVTEARVVDASGPLMGVGFRVVWSPEAGLLPAAAESETDDP